MSYRSRESKRRKKAAVAKTKRQHRPEMASRYYLTKVKHPCRCSSCGCELPVRADMVYRHDGPVMLCVRCADRDPLVDYRVSLRWERERARRRAGRLAA